MKFMCRTCGCHFPEDFEDTLKEGCEFWEMRCGDTLSYEWKRRIWDYMTGFDYDRFSQETGYQFLMGGHAGFVFLHNEQVRGNDFEKFLPWYKDADEEDRKQFQREWFRYCNRLNLQQIQRTAYDRHMQGLMQEWGADWFAGRE